MIFIPDRRITHTKTFVELANGCIRKMLSPGRIWRMR